MGSTNSQGTSTVGSRESLLAGRMMAFGLVLAAMLPLLGLALLSYERTNAQNRALYTARLMSDAVEKQLRDRIFLLARQLDMAAGTFTDSRGIEMPVASDPARWPIGMHGVRIAPHDPQTQPASSAGTAQRPVSIGAPQRQGNDWRVPISRATPDGQRVYAQVDADLFAGLVQGYSLGPQDRINLLHADGVMVSRSHDNPQFVGRPVGQSVIFDTPLRSAASGSYIEESVLDGIERQHLFKRVSGLPLIIVVGLEQRDVLASWSRFAGVAFLLSLALGLSWAWIVRRLAQGQARQARLIADLGESIHTLNRTEERLHQAQSMAAIGEFEWDLQTMRVSWSEEIYRIHGQTMDGATLTVDEVLSRIDPRDIDRLRMLTEGFIASSEAYDTEYRIRTVGGDVRWIQNRARLVVDPDGRRYVRGTQQDVTELAQAREQLRQAESQYRLMFELNPLPMWIFDRLSLQFLAVNQSAIAKYGYSREEFLALTVMDVRPQEDVTEALAFMQAEKPPDDRGKAWRHRLKDGRIILVNNAHTDIEFDGRRAWLVLVHDITDQLQAEAEQRHSEERFRLIARATSDAVYDLDIASDTLWWSDSFYTTFGYSRGELPDTLGAWEAAVHPDDLARVGDSLQAAIDGNASEWEEEYCLRRNDGRYVEVIDRGYLLRDEVGRATRMVGGVLDVSERRRAEADLRLLRQAIEVTLNGIVISDARRPDHPVVYVNPAFESITGYTAAEMLGENCRMLQGDDRDQVAIQDIRLALREQREVRVVMRNYRKDGTLFCNEFHLAPVRDAGGTLTHYMGVLNDVTDRQQYEEQLAYRATHDELTGLPNRQLLMDRLQQAVLNAERYGREVAVVFIDLDDFKLVNDSLGHSAGDEVLRVVARRLQEVVRGTDTVGRFGGDEFVIVLTEKIGEDGLRPVIARVEAAVVQPIDIGGVMHTLTPSIGYCRYPEAGRDGEVLLMRADLAMYQAKQQGRNRTVAYRSEFDGVVSQRLQLVSQLRDALRREEFVLAFQPLFDSAGLPTAVEVLVRWQHPQRGLLLPDQFIAVCEESGLIVELGRRILREALRHHALLVQAGLGHLRIAVNVSAAQFTHGLETDIAALVAEFSLPPGILELELTESVIMARPEQAILAMRQIAASGVCISVDDFGTGYSSLAYLKRLPIERLKIDRSFVHDLGDNDEQDDAAICGSIIALAHSLGLTAVAEGVETEQQRDWLRARGCDELQGYLLGRPQPFEQLLDVLVAAAAGQETPPT